MATPGIPSFGDIVRAIELLREAYKALKDSGGAVSKYEESINFLKSFGTSIRLLNEYISQNPNVTFAPDIQNHLRSVEAPWKEFDEFLQPFKKSLDASSTRSAVGKVPRKINFAIKDMHGGVQNLKTATALPLHAVNTMLALQILEDVKNTQGKPFTTAQCDQITDAVHLTAVASELKSELAQLQANDSSHRASTQDQKRVLNELKDVVLRIDARITELTLDDRIENVTPIADSGLSSSPQQQMISAMLESLIQLQSSLSDLSVSISESNRHSIGQLQTSLELSNLAIQNKIDSLEQQIAESQIRVQRQPGCTGTWALGAATHIATGLGAAVLAGHFTNSQPEARLPYSQSKQVGGSRQKIDHSSSAQNQSWHSDFLARLAPSSATRNTKKPIQNPAQFERTWLKRESQIRTSKEEPVVWIEDSVPAYRLNSAIVLEFLQKIFDRNIKVYFDMGSYVFSIPRKLTSAEWDTLMDMRERDLDEE